MTSPDLEDLIRNRGCFDSVQNARIYAKFFSRMPHTFSRPLAEYRLSSRRVLDVGCSYGMNLIHFGPGSAGIDADPRMAAFAAAIGLSVACADAERHLPFDDASFDAVWCSNFLEHVRSPHDLLQSMRRVLRADGLIFIKVPLVPSLVPGFLWRAVFGQPGYLAEEHLYAYTADTLRLIIERSGFPIIDINAFFPFRGMISDACGRFFARHGVTGTFVARKDPSWRYPDKRPTN